MFTYTYKYIYIYIHIWHNDNNNYYYYYHHYHNNNNNNNDIYTRNVDVKEHITPNLPTEIIPKIPWLELSGRFPMGLGIPPLKFQILLESKPLKSRILVRRLAVHVGAPRRPRTVESRFSVFDLRIYGVGGG